MRALQSSGFLLTLFSFFSRIKKELRPVYSHIINHLLTSHSVSFSFYVSLTCGSVHKHVKRELDQYSPIRTSRLVNKIYTFLLLDVLMVRIYFLIFYNIRTSLRSSIERGNNCKNTYPMGTCVYCY